jgi:hypothetical protein
MFSFTWLDISKHWFTLLLASITSCLWFDRKHTHRRLDELHKMMEAIQYHMVIFIFFTFRWQFTIYTSLQSNPVVPAFAADAGNSLPILAKTTPANWETMAQTMQAIIEPATAEPQAEISHTPQSNVLTPQENASNMVESSKINLVDRVAEQHVEHLESKTTSGFSLEAKMPFHPESSPPADVQSQRSGPGVLTDRLFPIRTHDLTASDSEPLPPPTPADIPSPLASSAFLPLPSDLSSASFPSPPAVQRSHSSRDP